VYQFLVFFHECWTCHGSGRIPEASKQEPAPLNSPQNGPNRQVR
jgi:hypothetical protein